MAVTYLTDLQLAAALRLGDGVTALEEPTLGIVSRLCGVAAAQVEVLAPAAPDPVKAEFVVRLAGYLFDSPQAGRGANYANACTNSGAANVIALWRAVKVVAITPDDEV